MKDKILTLIIGILIGAIITSAGFVIYINTNKKGKGHDLGRPPQMNQSQDSKQNGGTPPELPNGEAPKGNNGNTTNTENNEQTQSNS